MIGGRESSDLAHPETLRSVAISDLSRLVPSSPEAFRDHFGDAFGNRHPTTKYSVS